MAKLTYEYDELKHELTLRAGGQTFGRGDSANVVIPSKRLSREHFKVFQRDGAWYVQDMGSSNGTLLNSRALEAEPYRLAHHEQFTAGGIAFTFLADVPPPPAPVARVEERRPSAPKRKPALVLYQAGPRVPVKEFRVDPLLRIGRGPDNGLVIDNNSLSGRHCEITFDGMRYTLQDLGTANGTFVRGERIIRHTLANGDVIELPGDVRLNFIDPLGAAVGEVAPSAPPPRAPAKPLPVKSGRTPAAARGAVAPPTPRAREREVDESERKVIEALEVAPSRYPKVSPGRAWAKAFLVVFLLGGIFAGAAWFAPERFFVKPKPSQPARGVDTPPQFPAFSFEDEGPLGGWELRVVGGAIQAGLEREQTWDGDACLVLRGAEGPASSNGADTSGSGLPTGKTDAPLPSIVLTSLSDFSLGLERGGVMSVHLRGQGREAVRAGNGNLLVVVALLVPDERAGGNGVELELPVGYAKVPLSELQEWRSLKIPLTVVHSVRRARLAITLLGAPALLWMDRINITPDGDRKGVFDRIIDDCRVTSDGNATLTVERTGSEERLTLTPAAMSGEGDLVPARWTPRGFVGDERQAAWLWEAPLLSGKSPGCRILSGTAPRGLPTGPEGVELSFDLNDAARLALHLQAKLAPSQAVHLYDGDGNDIALEGGFIFPVASVSEIGVGELTLVFPRRVAVQVVRYKPGERAFLRILGLGKSGERRIVARAYRAPIAAMLMFQRLLSELEELEASGSRSAALERAQTLAAADPSRFPDIARIGRARVKTLEELLAHYWLSANADLDKARSGGDREAALKAAEAYHRILDQFPGEPRGEQARALMDEALALVAERPVRPPETPPADEASAWRVVKPPPPADKAKRAEDAANALEMLRLAREDHESGNWLRAYIFADNVRWNFHYTPSAPEAGQLAGEIEAAWKNTPQRDAWVEERLKAGETSERTGALAEALETYRSILRRYPRAPNAPDVLTRLRKIEGLKE